MNTRRAFLHSILSALVALPVVGKLMPKQWGDGVRGLGVKVYPMISVTNRCASKPVYPKFGYMIVHRRG